MEKEDLMVGDWVHCFHPRKQRNVPIKVSELIIHDDYKDDLAPIPMSEEFLEKNFKKEDEEYILEDGKPYVIERIDNNCMLSKKYETLHGDKEYVTLLLIYSVHQLQHFMRLFDIKKEIVL